MVCLGQEALLLAGARCLQTQSTLSPEGANGANTTAANDISRSSSLLHDESEPEPQLPEIRDVQTHKLH